ncbi:MAG TPA: hypothetical protein DIT32_03460 [Peptococcaceae bacterium]|nr:hypothetical protein [Peptococcaceae bacterium]
MRKLQTQDIFNTFRIIKKANLKEEIKPIIKMAGSGELNIEDVGIEGILGVIEIMTESKAEQAIYEVLSGPFEMDPAKIRHMDLIELAANLETLSKENDLKRFFTLLAGLLSKK